MAVRRASHAGSWYNESGTYRLHILTTLKLTIIKMFLFLLAKELGNQLENWLGAAELTHGPARAIIAPYVFYFLYIEINAIDTFNETCEFFKLKSCGIPILWCLCCIRLSPDKSVCCVSSAIFI